MPDLSCVSETAILTLRVRAEEHERSDRLFADPLAAEWFRRIKWPLSLDQWWTSRLAGSGITFRADTIDHIIEEFHPTVSSLSVIELGCGLSTRSDRLAHLPFARWTDVDLPGVISLRESLGAHNEHIAASVTDFTWMDQLQGDPSQQLFIAEGLLYYLQRSEVDALFSELHHRFPGAAIVFDVVGKNDFASLLENTSAVGAPIAWHLDGDFSEALNTFGLSAIGEFDPDRIMSDAFSRYWHRLTTAEKVASYHVMSSAELRRGRSGTVFGRLGKT